MTQVANEVTSFKSEVLSNGGSIQRAQNREELKERERLRKEAEDKHAAEVHARRVKAREERDLKLAERVAAQKASDEEKVKKAQEQAVAKLAKEQEAEKQKAQEAQNAKVQKAEPKSQATSLLDDLSKASNSSKSLAQISEDIEEGEELGELEAEPIFAPIKGEVQVPAMMTAPEGELEPQAYDLRELLPAPAAITVDVLPQPAIQTESAEEFINRVLNLSLIHI